MRLSELFGQTLREPPADAEIASHQLLVRGAFMRKVAAGVYAWLPLGLRVLRNIEEIIREEMNRHGGVELLMPALLPKDLLDDTGRWETFGVELYRLKDLADREWYLGPTHEECVTWLASTELPSYKDLPSIPYQIQWKYRYAPRPRGGLLRGREFLMKDAYSFDADETGLAKSYEQMVAAYNAIFERCGIPVVQIEAQAGVIGGSVNHEFIQPADAGEDTFVSCPGCGYAANTEAARSNAPAQSAAESAEMAEVHTPGQFSVEEMSTKLELPFDRILKMIIYKAGDEFVGALIRGDREINEYKLGKLVGGEVQMIEPADFKKQGWSKGYVGPVGLEGLRIIADHSVKGATNVATGANKDDHHLTGVDEGRDFSVDEWADLAVAADGDGCPNCDATLELKRGIEVGHVFQLGTKYSKAMKAEYATPDGKREPYVMGCYGLGVSRVVASILEVHHDDRGISWPRAVAPFDVHVVVLADGGADVAESLRSELESRGVSVLIDDRPGSAGVKFGDADLIGCPLQVVIGKSWKSDGTLEVKIRRTGDRDNIGADVESVLAALDRCP